MVGVGVLDGNAPLRVSGDLVVVCSCEILDGERPNSMAEVHLVDMREDEEPMRRSGRWRSQGELGEVASAVQVHRVKTKALVMEIGGV